MPESTPIYGFTYPCEGESVDAADFTLLATQIDTQLTSIQADSDYATGRYASISTASSQAAIVAGVDTAIVTAGSTYVIPADGVYWVNASVVINISAADASSARLRVRLNATPMFGHTTNLTASSSSTGIFGAMGTMRAATGDTVSLSVVFFGTGPGTALTPRLQTRQIVRIF